MILWDYSGRSNFSFRASFAYLFSSSSVFKISIVQKLVPHFGHLRQRCTVVLLIVAMTQVFS